ncbi:MAG: hypothetical protein ABFE13_11935 [Phycisphaerales bacterium]
MSAPISDPMSVKDAVRYLQREHGLPYGYERVSAFVRDGLIAATQPVPGGKRFVTMAELDRFATRPALEVGSDAE